MVELMIQGLQRHAWQVLDQPKESRTASEGRHFLYHVNARVSDDLKDVGGIRPQKLLRLLRYCCQALWYRVRFGADTLYYIPAPAKKSAIVRDWIVMALVRPWFRQTVLHWHAVGLGLWAHARSSADDPKHPRIFGGVERIAKTITRWLYARADLAIVLTEHNRAEAELLSPRRTIVVANGIEDPCPDFEKCLLPLRRERLRARMNLEESGGDLSSPVEFRILFLGHCTREKGLFDALEAVKIANVRLRAQCSPLHLVLTVAGQFMNEDEEIEFRRWLDEDREKGECPRVRYAGFLDASSKDLAFKEHDCLVAPSHWESFGLTVVEAMAYGLIPVISAQPNLVSLLPDTLRIAAPVADVMALAENLLRAAESDMAPDLRSAYLNRFTLEKFEAGIRHAFEELDNSPAVS
jgi:glycosyltransferase involved in cell wall biosynthesis